MSKSSRSSIKATTLVLVFVVGTITGLLILTGSDAPMRGKVLGQKLIEGAAKDGRLDLSKDTPRFCFVKDYFILQRCLQLCFKNADARIKGEPDESTGYWFAAYEVPNVPDTIFVSAVPQPLLVWDYLENELQKLPGGAHADPMIDGCGIAESVQIKPTRGVPVIAAEMPGIFPEDGTYNKMTPLLSKSWE